MVNCARVIALIDMDCFYVQVEERDDPSLKGQPAAVVQYNAWKGGGLIAVNYEARAKGVNRHMRGEEAKSSCPEIILVKVPELRGKADLTKYRTAGSEVIKILSEFPTIVERASVDEAYLDLTQMVDERISYGERMWDMTYHLEKISAENLVNNFVLGHESSNDWLSSLRSDGMMTLADVKLAIGADIVGQMRRAVFERTGFRCSAGIAHNKVLAKLVCGLNKPNKQTVLPHSSVGQLFVNTQIKKVRNLGGKLGDSIQEQFGCVTMEDLAKVDEKDLLQSFGHKTGFWLYHLARGEDDEPVTARQLVKSIGCNKNFPGREALKTLAKIKHWIEQLSAEVVERLQKDFEINSRKAKSLTLHISFDDRTQVSKSCGIPPYEPERMIFNVHQIIEQIYLKNPSRSITSLGLIASKFEEEINPSTFHKIDSYFSKSISKSSTPSSTITHPLIDFDPEVTLRLPTVQEAPSLTSVSVSLSSNLRPSAISDEQLLSPKPSTSTARTTTVGVQKKSFNTSEFLKRLAETENWVATVSDKSQRSSVVKESNSQEPIFNRSLTQDENDRKILNLGKNHSSVNFQLAGIDSVGKEKLTKKSPLKAFTQKCERCGQSIVIWDLPVHMDYHYAKDVQREINGLPPLGQTGKKVTSFEPVTLPKRIKPVTKRKGQGSTGQGTKRGRSGSGTDTSMRSIQSYFLPMSPQVQTPANQGA